MSYATDRWQSLLLAVIADVDAEMNGSLKPIVRTVMIARNLFEASILVRRSSQLGTDQDIGDVLHVAQSGGAWGFLGWEVVAERSSLT